MRPLASALVTLLLVAGCGGSGGEPRATSSQDPSASAAPDVSTNAAVCRLISATPRQLGDTTLLWAQVNSGATLEETLAIGWAPGVYQSEADGARVQAEQLYKTLPVAGELVRLRPGIDVVSVAFSGTNLDASFKTTFILPASVVAGYVDTPEARNSVQRSVQVLSDLPPASEPNGLEVTDADGLMQAQC